MRTWTLFGLEQQKRKWRVFLFMMISASFHHYPSYSISKSFPYISMTLENDYPSTSFPPSSRGQTLFTSLIKNILKRQENLWSIYESHSHCELSGLLIMIILFIQLTELWKKMRVVFFHLKSPGSFKRFANWSNEVEKPENLQATWRPFLLSSSIKNVHCSKVQHLPNWPFPFRI